MSEPGSSPKRENDYRIVLITIVLTLGNLAICTHRSSRVYLYQQSLCLNYYRNKDPAAVKGQSQIDEELCKLKDVQSPLSMVEGVDMFCQLLPGKVL